MRLLRRLQTKYGISHPFCVLSLLACLVFCVLVVGYALISYDSSIVLPQSASLANVNSGELKMFGEELFDTVIGSYSQVVAIGIEPLLAVILQGVAGLINAVLGMPFDMETSYFSIPEILMIVLVIYSIGKFMQCFECTRSFTMLTFGEFERIFGYIMMIIIACRNITKIIYVCEKYSYVIRGISGGIPAELLTAVIVFSVGVVSSFIGIAIFYITKTMVLGLQILQLSISFLPFTSLLFEVLRSSATIIMAVFNLLFPRVGFAFNCATFILGIVLLSQTSSSVEYFRVMYMESILIPYYRFKGKIDHLYKEVPVEICRKCNDRKNLIVPVFSMEHFKMNGINVASHEKWWMEISEERLFFYRKKALSRKVEMFDIERKEKKWYYKDNWKCLELFDLNGPGENIIRLFNKPEREISFAVSREYEAIFKEITAGMDATNYVALKEQLTKERRKYIEQEKKAFYAAIQ